MQSNVLKFSSPKMTRAIMYAFCCISIACFTPKVAFSLVVSIPELPYLWSNVAISWKYSYMSSRSVWPIEAMTCFFDFRVR